MQDEVRDKSVALAIKVGKTGGRLTDDLLKWAIRKYLAQSQNPKIHHGKQSVKQLVGQGTGVKSIDITEKTIKSFEKVAKKYGVDFALKKNPEKGEYYPCIKPPLAARRKRHKVNMQMRRRFVHMKMGREYIEIGISCLKPPVIFVQDLSGKTAIRTVHPHAFLIANL